VERRRRIEIFETWRDGVLAIVVAALLVWAGVVGSRIAPSKAGPKMNGTYEVKFAGCGSGTGKAVVNGGGKRVTITGTLTDASGNVLPFNADKLDIDGTTYHFRGEGTLDGSPVTITGRFDPDDTNVKKCRIAATFLAADGSRAGRVVGEHQ
jgi:hypothetical protein